MTRPIDRRAPTSETWLRVVAAVDYLSRGHRPGFTVWDAVEEALRWYTAHLVAGHDDALAAVVAAELPWDDPDPLLTVLERFVEHQPPVADEGEGASAEAINVALTDWLCAMANDYNEGHRFAMPTLTHPIPSPTETSE